MSLVEKEITQKNVELAEQHPELLHRHEREVKLLAGKPHYLSELFEDHAETIEQIYLSHPNDEFSLRIRRREKSNGTEYTTTLKDRGHIVDGALDRMEIETPISQEAYEWLAAQPDFARLYKRRAEPIPGVTIDFIGDKNIQIVEIEHNDPTQRTKLAQAMDRLAMGHLADITALPRYDNEALAHMYSGRDKEPSLESLDAFTDRIVKEMIAHYAAGKQRVVMGITGMSGSGKTTVTKGIQERIVDLFGESYSPTIISTDDYHFGKQKLEEMYGAPWNAWDDPRTYNTAELADDLTRMAEGGTILRRHFDFDREEVLFDEEITPSPFVIIEGLYAGSKELEKVRDLHFELPTGIATSIGRDIRRLMVENRANRAFPTPESRLQYQIETALPLYLSQERPQRNRFNASMRPMAERAFMLERLQY